MTVVLFDESIRLEREYAEVKRKAAVGERIKIVSAKDTRYPVGKIGICTRDDQFSDGSIDTTLRFPGSEQDGFIDTVEAEYVVLEPTDFVRHGGSRYRLVERKADVGERVVATNVCELSADNYRPGDVFTVEQPDGYGVDITDKTGEENSIPHGDYRVLEPVESAEQRKESNVSDDVLGLIANLAARVTEIERRLSNGKEPVNEAQEIAEGIAKLTGAQRKLTRDDVIERAKADVAELTKRYTSQNARIDFVVNRAKRTVVALRFYCGFVDIRGIAKCAPGDVFNTHIGRAIALRRALGLPVPDEYTNAPRPTEVNVGDIVRSKREGNNYEVTARFSGYDWKLSVDYVRGVRDGDLYVIDDSREEVDAN
jgi:hypothetical protein